ncbi:MAG: F0F1 ATP synthase subunit B' [Hyphomicrobiales bacterium]|nr:F0F1 ATP synthase subunit B' [Hyphomicrobiales bacterium]
MPQLEIGDFAPQLIWLAITFLALYLILSRAALPRIAEVLDERRMRIEADLNAAQALSAQTESAIAAYEQALAEAKAKAGAIGAKTREEWSAKLAQERAAFDKKIAAKNAEAEARITQLRTNSAGQIEQISREAASAVVDKLLGAGASNQNSVNEAVAAAASRAKPAGAANV